MKIKVTHEDKSVILDIPADKVMVVLADAYSYKKLKKSKIALTP